LLSYLFYQNQLGVFPAFDEESGGMLKSGAPERHAKQQVRKRILALRSAMTQKEYQERNRALSANLARLECVTNASHVMAYLPMASRKEADITEVIARLYKTGVTVSVPVVRDKHLEPCLYRPGDQLSRGSFGEPEPSVFTPVSSLPDAVIVPVVAADRNGGRIGYGAGYYDRFFSSVKAGFQSLPLAIGIAFELQLVDGIATDHWDHRLDIVVTEKEIITM